MTNFLTDADVSAAANFQEGEVNLAVEYTLPAVTLNAYRWRSGSAAPSVTPLMRVFNASNTVVSGSQVGFDSAWAGPQAWNTATIPGGLALSAGTYRMTVNTTHYCAASGFFGGGSITRSGVTAVQGRFGSAGVAPAGTSTALYGIDIDFTPSGGGTTPFTKTTSEQYRILNALGINVPEQYRILNTLTKSVSEQYRILNTLVVQAAETYRILAQWGLTAPEAYRIFNAWTKTAGEQFSIASGLNVSVVERYRVFAAWSKAVAERYAILRDTPTDPLPADVWVYLDNTARAILTAE